MKTIDNNVMFEPMKLGAYFRSREWSIPADVSPDVDGYRIMNAQGLSTWISSEEFEEQYSDCLKMTFSEALEHLKHGCKVARSGWNGKGMFIVYREGYPEGIPCNESTAKAFGYETGYLFKQLPYLQMRCADGTHQMWLASQSDLLADDWCIVE